MVWVLQSSGPEKLRLHTDRWVTVRRTKGWSRREEEKEESWTFDEGENLLVRDVSGLQVDLQSQEQCEQQFVILVETPGGITEHLKEGQQGFTRHFSSLKQINRRLLAFF